MSRWGRLAVEAAVSLGRSRVYTILMMAGLIIGIGAVVVIQEMGSGVQASVKERMETWGFGADAIYVSGRGGGLGMRRSRRAESSLTLGDVAAIATLEGVASVAPHQSAGRKTLSHQGRHSATVVTGVTPNYTSARNWPVARGRFITDQDLERFRRVVVLGQTTAQDLFGQADPLGQPVRVGKIPFTVVGILAPKGFNRFGRDRDEVALIPISTSRRRLVGNDRLWGTRVNLSDPARLAEVQDGVTYLLRQRHGLVAGQPDDFMVINPEALREFITRESRGLVAALTVISAVSLLVAAIVIANIMLVAVSERRSEIGVRRALGARRRDIFVQFLLESLAVALAGGLSGLGAGLSISRLATWLLEVPTAFSPASLLFALGFSTVVGLVAGVAPARRAARLTPVEALR